MSKAKIEPMSVKVIKQFIHSCASCGVSGCTDCPEGLSIALAWIHAEARAREAAHELMHQSPYEPDDFKCAECCDWLAVVKREVGWPEDS